MQKKQWKLGATSIISCPIFMSSQLHTMIKVGAVLEDLGKRENNDALINLAKAFHMLSVPR